MSGTATHNVPVAPTETYEEKRARQRTRREEREATRAYNDLKDKVRSEMRRQLDWLLKANINKFIVALAQGNGLRLYIEVAEQAPAVTKVPEPEKPLIEVVR